MKSIYALKSWSKLNSDLNLPITGRRLRASASIFNGDMPSQRQMAILTQYRIKNQSC